MSFLDPYFLFFKNGVQLAARRRLSIAAGLDVADDPANDQLILTASATSIAQPPSVVTVTNANQTFDGVGAGGRIKVFGQTIVNVTLTGTQLVWDFKPDGVALGAVVWFNAKGSSGLVLVRDAAGVVLFALNASGRTVVRGIYFDGSNWNALTTGVAPDFDPVSLGGWLFYARASNGAVDLSGNNDVLTATPTPPTIGNDAAYQNKPVFNCSGGKSFSVTLPSAPTRPYTIVTIARFSAPTLRAITDGTPGNNTGWCQLTISSTSSPAGIYLFSGTPLASGYSSTSPFVLIGVDRGDATSTISVNRLGGAASATGNCGARVTTNQLYVGRDVSNAAPWNDTFAEIGIRNGTLTAAQLTDLVNYAAATYGLSLT